MSGVPFKNYSSTLRKYSDDNQELASNYDDIIQSQTRECYYSKKYNTVDEASSCRLNPNIPVYDKKELIFVDNKPINVYKQFWQYKQHAGSIFTDWGSAGTRAVKEDISIRNLPLKSAGGVISPELTLGNTNNVRNSLQNYGKQYLLTTNLLNAQAFKNGISYDGNTSPYRGRGDLIEMNEIEHSNFENSENGDFMARMKNKLRVDLPPNYSNNVLTTWQFINPIGIKPKPVTDQLIDYSGNVVDRKLEFYDRLKFGTFNLNVLKLIGSSCFTENAGIIPTYKNNAVSVYADDNSYPPLSCKNYYENFSNDNSADCEYIGDGLYCSKNANYCAMPKNYYFPDLDTSFDIAPDGSNSLTIGAIMSPALRHFINNDLYNLNLLLILRKLIQQENDQQTLQLLNEQHNNVSKLFNLSITSDDYNNLEETKKYTHLFRMQSYFHQKYHSSPTVVMFIASLNIYKFGGNEPNFVNVKATVIYNDIQNDTKINQIETPGLFLVLPSMLYEDVFVLGKDTTGSCSIKDNDCCFKGPAGAFTDDHQYTHVKNDGKVNNLDNMVNSKCGANPYDAPDTF